MARINPYRRQSLASAVTPVSMDTSAASVADTVIQATARNANTAGNIAQQQVNRQNALAASSFQRFGQEMTYLSHQAMYAEKQHQEAISKGWVNHYSNELQRQAIADLRETKKARALNPVGMADDWKEAWQQKAKDFIDTNNLRARPGVAEAVWQDWENLSTQLYNANTNWEVDKDTDNFIMAAAESRVKQRNDMAQAETPAELSVAMASYQNSLGTTKNPGQYLLAFGKEALNMADKDITDGVEGYAENLTLKNPAEARAFIDDPQFKPHIKDRPRLLGGIEREEQARKQEAVEANQIENLPVYRQLQDISGSFADPAHPDPTEVKNAYFKINAVIKDIKAKPTTEENVKLLTKAENIRDEIGSKDIRYEAIVSKDQAERRRLENEIEQNKREAERQADKAKTAQEKAAKAEAFQYFKSPGASEARRSVTKLYNLLRAQGSKPKFTQEFNDQLVEFLDVIEAAQKLNALGTPDDRLTEYNEMKGYADSLIQRSMKGKDGWLGKDAKEKFYEKTLEPAPERVHSARGKSEDQRALTDSIYTTQVQKFAAQHAAKYKKKVEELSDATLKELKRQAADYTIGIYKQ